MAERYLDLALVDRREVLDTSEALKKACGGDHRRPAISFGGAEEGRKKRLDEWRSCSYVRATRRKDH